MANIYLRSSEMNEFLLTGHFGDLRIGMTVADVHALLGTSDNIGKGARGWVIEAYAEGSFQIAHSNGIVGLIAIYFSPDKKESPVLPPALKCKVPFSGLTTVEEFKAHLDKNRIPWEVDSRLREATAFKVGVGVLAHFDDGYLHSLIISNDGGAR